MSIHKQNKCQTQPRSPLPFSATNSDPMSNATSSTSYRHIDKARKHTRRAIARDMTSKKITDIKEILHGHGKCRQDASTFRPEIGQARVPLLE